MTVNRLGVNGLLCSHADDIATVVANLWLQLLAITKWFYVLWLVVGLEVNENEVTFVPRFENDRLAS
eukprot:5287238-Lingulodinium_polyedra.AAC.1